MVYGNAWDRVGKVRRGIGRVGSGEEEPVEVVRPTLWICIHRRRHQHHRDRTYPSINGHRRVRV